MADWLSLIGLIPLIERIWKRPKLKIKPIAKNSYFYRKYQFDKEEMGEPIGTVLEFCLTIENKGRGEAKVKQFAIKIKDIDKNYIDIKHIELIKKRLRNSEFRTIPQFRTCPTERYSKGKKVCISPPKEILVNDSYIIRIAADDRTPEGYLYFHIEDNILEDRETIECILKLKYGRRKAKGIFNLKRGDC